MQIMTDPFDRKPEVLAELDAMAQDIRDPNGVSWARVLVKPTAQAKPIEELESMLERAGAYVQQKQERGEYYYRRELDGSYVLQLFRYDRIRLLMVHAAIMHCGYELVKPEQTA
jgi:hypothetical protein